MADDDEAIDLLAAANDVVSNDRHPDTIKGYERKIKQMRVFARESTDWSEEIFDDPPSPDYFLKQFLGKQVQPIDGGSIRTSSTIRGHISAIKWWYSTLEDVMVNDDIESWFARFNK